MDVAKGYWNNFGKIKRVKTHLIYLLGNDPFMEVEYRRNKTQRRWSKAIVCAQAKNPKQALENVVGPIYDFKTIGPLKDDIKN